jgi:hypothetical protein
LGDLPDHGSNLGTKKAGEAAAVEGDHPGKTNEPFTKHATNCWLRCYFKKSFMPERKHWHSKPETMGE